MSNRSVKIGASVMFAMGVYALILALLWIFITDIMFVSDFAHYTGQTWADYVSSSPRYGQIYIITKKLIGLQLVPMSILVIFVSHFAYRQGKKWSWYALLIAGLVTWGSLIGYKIVINYFKPGFSSTTFPVGALLWAVGLAIPAKAILGQKGD